jgi:hypothetical protein
MALRLTKLALALCLALASCAPPAAFAQEPQTFAYQNITGDATTVVKSSPGVLHSITFNGPTATTTVTLYDNASAASGIKIGTITVPSSPMPVTLFYDTAFWNGLVVVTGTASSDITVSFR